MTRRKGTPNKTSAERSLLIAPGEDDAGALGTGSDAFAGDAHAFLVAVYKDPTQERHARQDAAKAALPYEKSRPVTVTLANQGGEPVKVRSELEIGRRLAFVLELIARGEVKAQMPEPSSRQKGSRNKRTQAREARRFQSSTASRRQRCCNGLDRGVLATHRARIA